MHERFQLQRRLGGVDLGDLRKGQFARQHHALRPLLTPERRRIAVGGVRLGGDVQRQAGRGAPCQGEGAGIGDERRVGADLLQIGKGVGEGGKVGIAGEDVGGDIYLFAARVRIGDGLLHLFRRKVAGKGAEGKLLSAQIDGVCTEVQRRFEFFKVARGGEQFGFSEAARRGRLFRSFKAARRGGLFGFFHGFSAIYARHST